LLRYKHDEAGGDVMQLYFKISVYLKSGSVVSQSIKLKDDFDIDKDFENTVKYFQDLFKTENKNALFTLANGLYGTTSFFIPDASAVEMATFGIES
jgi:hypothetical protein